MKFINDCRLWWRLASVRLAFVAGAVASWAAMYPDEYKQLVTLLPEWSRPLVGPAVAFCAILARLMHQPRLEEKRNGN